MKRALAALLVVCVMLAAQTTASHGHLQVGKRCEVCATLHGVDRAPAAPTPAPPALRPHDPVPVGAPRGPRTVDVLSYSPKNSPPQM